ncbi:MAG: hypothetical protein ACOYIP_00260 [Coriobacteriales bacterium]
MKRLGLIIVALVVALCSVTVLAACGKGGSSIAQPTTAASTNPNGAVFAINLAQYSDNLNVATAEVGSDIPKIESLDQWLEAEKATDDAGAYTVRATSLETSTGTPVFVVSAYDAGNAIREVKVTWDASSALAQPDVLKDYCISEIRAITGADANIAGMMYDTARATPFTNGASKDLTYACYGNARCYYLVSNGYHIVTIEPYSDGSKAEEQAKGTFVYMDVTADGVTQSQAAGANQTANVQTTGDSNQAANSSDAQAAGTAEATAQPADAASSDAQTAEGDAASNEQQG